ncbi:MAG: phosphoribosylanthranilate isomerase [Verrucomicrobiota bacterium]
MDVKIKICGITNLADATAAVEAGADALGFMFYEESPRAVTVETAAEIVRHLPAWILKVGVFVNPSPDLVMTALGACALNLLQFHGDESPEFCASFGVMSIKAFRVKDADSLLPMPDYRTDVFLLDSFVNGKAGGTGEKFNWDLAVQAKKFGKPIFLAGGLTPENVRNAVREVQPFGVDVSSGVESAPGKKDHGKIWEFVQAARNAA